MRPIKKTDWKKKVEEGVGLLLVVAGTLLVSYLFYLANFASCPPGTTQISGYSGGKWTNVCVSQR